MKIFFLWLIIAIGPCFALAQTKIIRSYPVKNGQTLDLNFDYPKIVQISTWNNKEISITATIKINDGESDGAFSLVEHNSEGEISISNKLNMDLIPQSYYTVENGNKIRFNTKRELEAYISKKGGNRPAIYQQKDIEISLDIKVPVKLSTKITSVYGLVKLQDFHGPIKVDATYGGIDASLVEKSVGKLQLTTHYGKIYTNLNLQPTENIEKDFFTSMTAVPGKGPGYNFASTYGNIYLRSATK